MKIMTRVADVKVSPKRLASNRCHGISPDRDLFLPPQPRLARYDFGAGLCKTAVVRR